MQIRSREFWFTIAQCSTSFPVISIWENTNLFHKIINSSIFFQKSKILDSIILANTIKFSNYCKFVDGTTFYRLLSVKSCVRWTDFVSYINMFILSWLFCVHKYSKIWQGVPKEPFLKYVTQDRGSESVTVRKGCNQKSNATHSKFFCVLFCFTQFLLLYNIAATIKAHSKGYRGVW